MKRPSPAHDDWMTRRSVFVRPTALTALIAAVALTGPSDRPSVALTEQSRLIVLVTIDALRADHLGIYGYARPTSPYIDAFARESLVIADAIAQAPYTKASIASLMTGLYPSAHKTYTTVATIRDAMDGRVGDAPRTDVLPESVTTLAEALTARGYATAAITTNPFLIRAFGFAQGFDSFEFMAADGFAPADQVLGRALRIIESRDGRLFLWVHLMEPHSPYDPGDAFERELPPVLPARHMPADVSVPDYLSARPSRDAAFYESLYDREIRLVDAAFGCFLTKLRRMPVWRDTVVVLTADHGEQFLEHGALEHNTGLHDELIRVPLILRVPGHGSRFLEAQAQLVDLMPTLVALGGAPAVAGLHGRDLHPLLRGEAHEPEPAYSELVGKQYAVRTRDWKLIAGPGEHRELYALARDPGEQYNLAQSYRRQTVAMEQVLEPMVSAALKAGDRIRGASAPVDPSTRKRLETLGYVQR